MANPEHLAVLKQGVEQWNKWRTHHLDVLADLREADLTGANLACAYFGKANLGGAIFDRANLSGANFGGAHVIETNLSATVFSDLIEAHLRKAGYGLADLLDTIGPGAHVVEASEIWVDSGGASLAQGSLREANLSGAVLSSADLSGAKFNGALVLGTIFANVDLSVATGLDTVVHRGPSTVGIDTIYKSGGKIPEVFLRGCGVPDEFIAYIGSMVGRPIEYHSCFISSSTHDQEFADLLCADLQDKGVRCWFAPHDIKGGRKIHEQIDNAIRLHDKLLLILSEYSMSSNWVKTEIANVRQREEGEKKNLLFPITLAPMEEVKKWKLFDADRGIDSAREIREYFIPDFSNWKDHDSYQAAFQRLVKDLKAEGTNE